MQDNILHCQEFLSLFLPLDEVTIARIVGVIVRTQSDDKSVHSKFLADLCGNNTLDLSQMTDWDADTLIYATKQLAPELNWATIMENLDHEGFYIPNEAAFYFLMSVYKHAGQGHFPLRAICGSIWKNAEGQISLLKYAVSAPPEVFTFAHSGRQLSVLQAYVDVVNDHKVQIEHANHAWLCLDLLEVLCQLAERDHASSVRSILEHPLKYCPEVLLLGMAHINTASNLLQQEVSSAVIPILLQNADASGMIVHLWHVNPYILLRGLVDALSIDPENMSRFLAACQEIKILSPILDMIPYPFGVRLAALASCKGHINLEKWLSSNLNAYKDAFYEFLKEVHLPAQVVTSNHFCSPNALRTIYSEASSTFLKVLQSHSGLVSSPHLSLEMDKLHVTYMGTNSRFKSSGSADLSSSDYYSEDIEAEANLYFHQLFSGQVTNDTMIRMLAHLKESTEKREQAIFRCMIVKLLTESFAKYPVRQLQMSAVLFGSLIKNQLITDHTLGIALLAVLDALHKSPSTNMYVFGVGALTQFVDRLIEWPDYVSLILKRLVLRGMHSELVVFIEQALARTSQAHAGHCPAVDEVHQAKAGLYFNQLFSGQLTNDEMIEMLAHFKESTDNRERAIFGCMIVLLFREFKLFAHFSKRVLKIYAVFTGSLIKNQLITNHTLDIALQNVLDSLHEPADSKMFYLGIRVLAQFVDRMIEWPHYCNRIVQISHVCSSHPELVAFVERGLSRVSQAHASQSSAADGCYANDIEAEATLHFQQMFSGQLTSDAVIQMLAQLKGSTDNRQQAIFPVHDC
ncbi:CCR4-NOT transcription complex subunit 1-like isoform X3 [Solanum tuberosum]|uniref:CCR4-NOT transcription complex subunit 1-like isoform X3 n=1 Tax=Solanum tuberosum TaxID=4113 RepID=UPI00073A1AE2|nr:PREDICTED: CCR4-NOT transcription complex subunit 1-like isoform X3 [Solanum tuberosum]